jgi:hypothetical protein
MAFYSILKKEAVHHAHFHTREQARQAVFDFIERFYTERGFRNPLVIFPPWMRLPYAFKWLHDHCLVFCPEKG